MFHKRIRKILSAILSLTVMMGILAIGGAGGIGAEAASGSSYVTIEGVTRHYKNANSFFTLCNDYRKANGVPAWTMDKDTLEAAMVRASELALYLSDNCPDNSNGVQHITGTIKNQLIAYDIFSVNNTFTEMKNNPTSNAILLGGDTVSAGVGVVTVNNAKYLVLYTTSKTPTKVSDSVLTQSNVTLNQRVHMVPANLGDISMPYINGQQLYCGGSVAAHLKVKNKRLKDAYVMLTPDNMTVKSSDEKVMKRSGDRMYAVNPGTATVSIYMTDYGYIGASCLFKAMARSFSECSFSSIPNQYYTGKPICPNVTVKNAAGDVMSVGTDYALSYTNNVEVGTATVLITGMGAYAGESKRVYFNIIKSGGSDDPTTNLTINVSVSKSIISLGQSTIITAKTSGEVNPVKYTYAYADYGTTNWTVLATNSSNNQYTFTPPESKKYYLRATATDAKNRTASQTAVVKVDNTFTCTATLSASPITINHAVTISGAYSGGSSPYTYAFYVQEPGASTLTTIRDYSASNSASFTPTVAGTYLFTVKCKDKSGTVATATKSLTAVNEELTNNSSVQSTSVTLGMSITMKGAAKGGLSPYQYCFYYKRAANTSWTLKQGYSSTRSVSFKPRASCTYNICIKVKDKTGKVAKKYIDVTVKPELINHSKLSAAKISHGESVKVTCAGSGGSGGYTYAVYYKQASKSAYTLAREYASGNIVMVTPKHTGDYTVRVKLKDSNGKVTKKDLTVNVGPVLSNTSKLAAASITKGKSVTVTCSATGGKASYTYAVWYKQTSQSKWTKARDYASGTSVQVTPKHATTYTIRVKAKDSLGKIVNKDLKLTVK